MCQTEKLSIFISYTYENAAMNPISVYNKHVYITTKII